MVFPSFVLGKRSDHRLNSNNLDKTLQFEASFTVAVVDILLFNDKLYDFLTKTCGHFSSYECHKFYARKVLWRVQSSSQNYKRTFNFLICWYWTEKFWDRHIETILRLQFPCCMKPKSILRPEWSHNTECNVSIFWTDLCCARRWNNFVCMGITPKILMMRTDL